MDTANLLELAERCEAATGPDRDIDLAIFEACGWVRKGGFWSGEYWERGGRRIWLTDKRLPAPTASLDAAMTLVPEENDSWSLMKWPQDGKPTFRATVSWTVKSSHKNASGPYVMHKPHLRRAEAATPALALCAAALRARAS
jgi:hypothetical protein